MKKELYIALRAALRSSTRIRWIDWQKGQFSRGAQSTSLPLPAVLLDLKTFDWIDGVMGQQEGSLRLYVDVYMPYYEPLAEEESSERNAQSDSNAADHTETERQAETLELLNTLDEIYGRLQGFQHEGLQRLSRSKEERLLWSDEANILAYRLEFRSRLHPAPLEQHIQSHHILKLEPKWNTFLSKNELKTAAPQALLDSLSAGSDELIQQLARENIDRISSYLQGRYDTEAIFSAPR